MIKQTKSILKLMPAILVCGSAGLFSFSTAAAQEDDDERLEEITVTARKTNESLQDVPIAISVLSGDFLETARLNDTQDLYIRVPGLGFGQPFKSFTPTAIRGASTQDDSIGVEPNVGIFIDQVFVGSSTSVEFDLFDLERVEVLKGPQGTIFGRNSNGGVIHYVTRTPDEEFRAATTVTVGNHDRVEVGGYITGEIKDGVYGSLSARNRNTSGWVRNLVTGNMLGQEKVSSARAKLRFVPSDDLDIILSTDLMSDQSYGAPRFHLGPEPEGLPDGSAYVDASNGNTSIATGHNIPDVLAMDLDGAYDRVGYGVSATIKWDTGIGTFHSITSYRDFDGELFNFDFDSVNGRTSDGLDTTEGFPYQQTLLSAFSQEFRLDWTIGDSVDVISGLFYLDEEQYRIEHLAAQGIPGSAFFAGDTVQRDILDQEMNSTSLAFFTEANIRFSDMVTLTLGGRWTRDEKDGSTTCHQVGPFWCGFTYTVNYSDEWTEPTYRAILDFNLSDNAMVYGSYAKGVKTGGFSNSASACGGSTDIDVCQALLGTPYDPEFSDSYELGARLQFADGRVTLNPTLFYVEYTDIQVLFLDGPSQEFISENLGSGENTGLELDLRVAATDNLDIWATYAYQDSEYGANLQSFGTPVEGNQLQLTPEHSFTMGFNYSRDLSSGRSLTFSGDYVQKSRQYDDSTNNIEASTEFKDLINLSVDLAATDRVNVSLWVNNLLDERNEVGTNSGFGGFVYSDAELAANANNTYPGGSVGIWRTYTPPRSYGLTFRWEY